MAENACHRCGTPRVGTEEFCPVCDTFFAWHEGDVEVVDPPPPAAPPDDGVRPAAVPPPYEPPVPGPAVPAPPPAARPKVDRVRPPVVSTDTTEVLVAPTAPGTFPLLMRNSSTIVEAYEVEVVDRPSWLTVVHGDTNLLPDESRTVAITLGVAAGALAVAQRYPATVRVRSGVDPARAAEVALTVVVPRSGPPATVTAHPSLVRLQDTDRGRFGVRIDNRASNHPRTYVLSAADAEGVVTVGFVPSTVEVPAGQVAEATAQLTAPAPPPGREASRQLAVTATDEQAPVAVQVTIAQATTAPPERRPLKMRLEPSQVAVVDQTHARLDVVVDNRGGHEDVVVKMRGRDPAGALSFSFDHDGLTLQQGRAVRFGMTIASAPAPPGTTVTRPFTVIAAGGGLESEIDGTLELTARATAITTAALRLVPDHLVVSSGRGTFRVEVDNRRSAYPLQVRLTGADEFGRASLRFNPPEIGVAPGQVGVATVVVAHPKPDGGSSESRRIRVSAGAGNDAVHAEAVFTQRAQSYRIWWAYVVAILGIVLVGLGALLALDGLDVMRADGVVRELIRNAEGNDRPAGDNVRAAVVVVSLAFVLLSLVMMLFGLVGTTGRGVRAGAVVAALFAGAALVAGTTLVGVSVGGFGLVLAGAVVAFVGGVLIRHFRS